MEGIFQYQKTHNEELQSESLKSALVKCFQATGITPTSGTYKKFSFDTFKSRGNHKANAHLFKVYELQEKERIHACMLLGGLDDQDPNDWDDEECRTDDDLNIPVAIDDEEDSSSMTTTTSCTGTVLSVPAPTMCSSEESEEDEDGEDSEELDSTDAGPSGECSMKRGARVTRSEGGGKRRKK